MATDSNIVDGAEASWPQGAGTPAPTDAVAVLMTESMARRFERTCLGENTVGHTELAGPVLFCEDDLPTYIIGVVGPVS